VRAYAALDKERGELERLRLGGGAGRAGSGYAEVDRVDSAVATSTRRLRAVSERYMAAEQRQLHVKLGLEAGAYTRPLLGST